MISNVAPLGTMSYSMMSSISSGGRTYVPVKPSQFGYSQFQYVAGYPAANGQQGVSVDKIKILNTLIEQLITMKQKNVSPPLTTRSEMTEDQINTLIKQYQSQIQTAAATAQNIPYKPVMPQTGAIFNLVA
jgi:hypothetical protein